MAGGSSPRAGRRAASGSAPDARRTTIETSGVHLLARLKKRRDFLRLARGRKVVRRAFVLQAAPSETTAGGPVVGPTEGDVDAIRIGFTASRKIGGAVQRNRAKRRLRALVAGIMPGQARAGMDYVLIARAAVLTCPFQVLEADLTSALAELARTRRPASPAA